MLMTNVNEVNNDKTKAPHKFIFSSILLVWCMTGRTTRALSTSRCPIQSLRKFPKALQDCQNKLATGAFHQLFWMVCRLLWMLVGQFWTWYWRNKMEITTYFWMEPPTQKPTDNPGFVYHTSWRTSSPKRKFCDNIPTSHFNFSAQRRIVFG